ncbi:uncharacterized protein B0H18DRAFT_97027 [Fomitopsis serialis]|uniref:uncharacterized protein n=1 Tax=Fomitopsis serialis TaxID=139415 RepID=UPI0020086CC7|nr:uncharacterized protein B0H18DRAFT_97027 [Neoantrodia serialis]KAH9915402.1 hypothetical protein B0H18DRAFT_97027 [Neoantrodia serialis]
MRRPARRTQARRSGAARIFRGVFPQELCDMVINLASDDQSTMRACSSVARSWVRTSRPHIFKIVTFKDWDDVTAFLAIISSHVLRSDCIVDLVYDVCISEDASAIPLGSPSLWKHDRLPDVLRRFNFLDTLRLDRPWWTPHRVSPVVAEAIVEVSRKAARLYLYDAYFKDIDDMVPLLSSAPQRSCVCITKRPTLEYSLMKETYPIHQKVSIDTFRGDLVGYTEFCLAMRSASTIKPPFSVTIKEVHLEDTNCDHVEDVDPDEAGKIQAFLASVNLSMLTGVNPTIPGILGGYTRLTNLVVHSLRIDCPTLLETGNMLPRYLVQLLEWRFVPARQIHFVVDGSVDDMSPRAPDRLDSTLDSLALEDPPVEVIFDTRSPADRLEDWIKVISARFPNFLARGTRVGVVCSALDGPKRERRRVAEHWWP